MTIDEIFENYTIDCVIQPLDLDGALRDIPRLHKKYQQFLTIVERDLRKLNSRYKKLYQLKTEYLGGYLNGTDEIKALGWPPFGRTILKGDIARFVEADPDIIKITESIGEEKEKSSILTGIVKEVMQRNWTIRAMIDNRKFEAGAF